MKIIKAFFICLMLMAIFSLIQIGFIYPIYLSDNSREFFLTWNAIAGILSSLLAYFIIFKIFWTEKFEIKEVLDFRKVDENILFYIVLIVVGLHLFNKPLWNIEEIWNYFNYSEQNTGITEPVKLDLYFLIRSISILFISPVLEELFFRKFLLSKLIERNTVLISVVFSGLLFSLIHIEIPSNLMPTFIFGIISGLIFIKTKSIAYSILLHFLYNLVIQLIRVSNFPLDTYLDSLNFNMTYWVIAVFGAMFAFIGVYRILKKKGTL